ncbi:MAG: hypothetical protein ABFS35_24135 [Bacteroidota bacterium]
MIYIVKVERGIWTEFKKLKGDLPINTRIKFWVEYFAEKNLTWFDFLQLSEVDKFEKMEFNSSLNQFHLNIDRDLWLKFKNNCRKNDVSANYVINRMINQFLKVGWVIELRKNI